MKVEYLKNYSLFKTIYANMVLCKRVRGFIKVSRGSILQISRSSRLIVHDANIWFGFRFSNRCKTLLLMQEGSLLECEGKVHIGNGCSVELYKNARVHLGNHVLVNENARIMATEKIIIGNDCAISCNVTIMDSDFHDIWVEDCQKKKSKEIIIGNNVLIGSGATILKGVTIGDGSVIAAGAIVTRDVKPNTIVAGNPGRVICENVTWKI